MTNNEMPDEAYLIKGVTNSFCGVWDEYQWSDQKGTHYTRAELVIRKDDAVLDAVEDVLKNAGNWFHIAMTGNIVAAPNVRIIKQKLIASLAQLQKLRGG